MGKRHLRWTQACGNSRHLLFSANNTVWADRSKAGSSCLRKDGEIKELSQHQAESVPCWSLFGFNVPFVYVCVCASVCLSSFSPIFLFPSPFLFPPVPS